MAESQIIRNRKYYKRNKILNIIRSNQNISRNDVKKITLYSIPTVRCLVDELIADGFIYEEECEDSRVGRKPVWLHLNPQGAYFIGVEFNARYLHCAMLNFVGDIIWKSDEALNCTANSNQILQIIYNHIKQALESTARGKEKCYGICVGVPGYIDKEKRLAISYSHLKAWENVPICELIEQRFSLPCYIDNNVNVMAFAYKWLYYDGDAQDFIFVSIRTGVRMVPVVDNQLILSKTGFSGQLGHVNIQSSSRMCSCGRFGCLNSEVSDVGLVSIIKEGIVVGRFQELLKMAGDEDHITVSLFCDSVLQNHKDSMTLMKRTAHILGDVLSTVVNIFAPEVIVLSGELTRIGDLLIQEIYNELSKNVIAENLSNLHISVSAFDRYIGATGAAAYVMQEEFEFIDKQI